MKITVLFEAENDSGEFIPVSRKMAQKLLESGTHYTETKTISAEYLEQNEVLIYTLLKINGDE